MKSPAAIIDVHGLTKRYGSRTVVDHVDMRVERGRIYGFLGPNGSGKTTTIRMLCGLLTPDEGNGTCLGFDIRTQARRIKREVGYMTQKFGLYEDLTIEENLAFIARVYAVPNAAAKVSATLEQLGLASRRTQLAGALSGGWKQRLALAACLLHDPQLLLLDEPTAGVDPKARREFWDQLHALTEQGLTVLVSTHYMDEAERCHRLAYIAYGRLLAQGTAEQLIDAAGLVTWSISGPRVGAIASALHAQPRLNVASFGNALHVSARSETELENALAPWRTQETRVTRIDTSLEDVFIALMQGAADNYSS
ncbi:ABC transporter ATP-binding protein [Noviherbaspirillum sp. Root189]|uniref:ABC transporter ATP-binding protein n=1 Tax=Noviherbaspirillum sp. Root189 TaxID=1736487 RepID=UPI00070B7EE3|nr:ABC transporter ATP-binding protein [Noviherbaspirillum sp. Root189]KRB94127.1 multidrug ABC transporter ATP-binding protein [Noviherbaspirillum sp. Root189]